LSALAQVDDGPVEKKPALQWKLRFDRYNGKQPCKGNGADSKDEAGFKAFEGSGKTIRKG
jgi:hypothetical protein